MELDTLFFVASKILITLLRVETWIVIGLALTIWAMLLKRYRAATAMSFGILIALLMLAVLPLGQLFLAPLERSYPVNPLLTHLDGIIVLGGAEDTNASREWGQTQLNASGERLTTTMALARQFPKARVIFAGGSGALRGLTASSTPEADVAKQFLTEQGLEPARLIVEDKSRNTAENARRSLEIAKPQIDEIFALVTSASHMPRALRSFEAAGWPLLVPYPVDFRTSHFSNNIGWNLPGNLEALNTAVKEHAGYLAYELKGH